MTLTAGHPIFTTLDHDFHMNRDEAKSFTKRGVLGPYAMCSPEEMDAVREVFDREVFDASTSPRRDFLHNRHVDHRLVYDVATHPAIRHRMESIYGPDLFLWRTNFFNKAPGGAEIPWHQDYNYWPLEPAVIISAWLAIDDVTMENAAVQVIPGSHRRILPHTKAGKEMAFAEMADPTLVEPMKADLVNMEMKRGEFFLFNERTLHHSFRNDSQLRRAGLAIRVIVPVVNVLGFDAPDHKLMLISGEDRLGFNETINPPPPMR